MKVIYYYKILKLFKLSYMGKSQYMLLLFTISYFINMYLLLTVLYVLQAS
jgi:hypothetical protein